MSSGPAAAPRRPLVNQTSVVALALLGTILGQRWIQPLTDNESLRAWCTMFVALVVQATPFLLGGVLLSAVISRFLSERLLRRVLPRNPTLAVPVAGIAGFGLPGCECAAVPVSEGLMRRGVAPAAALTFLLAAPAVNPAVIVSTAVAFPNDHLMVVARVVASLTTAIAVGWWCVARGDALGMARRPDAHRHGGGLVAVALHDFLHAGGFLVVGAMAAAAVNTFVPRAWVDSLAGQALLGVLALALFAFVAALCSESDAFVAASLTAFSDTAKLTFLVVGPAMDIKLAAMESGQFGYRFARQFVPVVLVVAVASAALVGRVLL
ncbi:permease [Nocardioides daejeonensis]|uniref:permease n=1 Tax=Nocardioides daejeonensis TaxID=1046556 RepID=UPI000D74B977|nr:permease [Nocardioides daejeonensis]